MGSKLSDMAAGMKRLSLELMQTAKSSRVREYLELVMSDLFKMKFIWARNEKYCLWWSVNLAFGDLTFTEKGWDWGN